MTLDYVLVLGLISVPLAILFLRLAYMIGLVYEISATVWMLPL